MRTRVNRASVSYGVALLATLLALLLRLALMPILGLQAPLLLFLAAVTFSAWWAGFKAGVLSTVLGALVGTYFFIPPAFSPVVVELPNLVRLGLFTFEGIFISGLCGALRRSQRQATAMAQSLQESEQRYRLMIEGVQDYAIFMLDPHGHIECWNSGAARLTGYQASEILGQPYRRLFSCSDRDAYEPERLCQVAITKGQYKGEGWRCRKDGSLFWADVTLTALFSPTGDLRGFASITRDISERSQAAEALQRSEERFRQAIMNAPLPIILHAEDGEVIQINRVWSEITGYAPQDIPSVSDWTAYAYGERKEVVREKIDQLYQLNTRVAEGEYSIRTKNGETRVWEFFSAPLGPLPDGRRCVISTAFDITERKQIEQALQDSEQRFKSLVEATFEGIIIYEQGMILDANQAYADLVHDSLTAIIGQPLPAWLRSPPTQTNSPPSSAQPYEIIGFTRHGTPLPLEVRNKPANYQGRRVQVAAIRNITERKQSEQALRRSAQRLEALQAIDRAIIQAESIRDIAQTALVRLQQVVTAEQAIILLFDETQGPELLAHWQHDLDLAAALPTALLPSAASYPDQDAVYAVADLAALPARSAWLDHQLAAGYHSFLAVALFAEHQVIGELNLFASAVAAFSDTDRDIVREVANQIAVAIQQGRLRGQLQAYAVELEHRVAERTAELQEANEALEAFAYSISHDLRAPLRAMEGLAQALLEDYADQFDDLGQQYARRIVGAAQDMEVLIRDLLDYSRLSRTDMQVRPIHMGAVLAEAQAQLQPLLTAQQATLTIAEPLPTVLGHRPILVQVVTNLLTNAMKFVPKSILPEVRVWAEEQDRGEAEPLDQDSAPPERWVRLWIEDNGIGIRPQHQERIFRVFERLHGAETYPGTGIGLAIVQKGIERMGGHVGVESQLGQGSRFWIELRSV